MDGDVNASPQTSAAVTVTPATAPVLFTYYNGTGSTNTSLNGLEGRYKILGDLSGTSLTFARWLADSTALTDVTVRYYLVDLADGASSTQWGTRAWAAGADANNKTIATNGISNTAPIAITTTANHLLSTGDRVCINSAGASLAAGCWNVTSTGATTFTLDNSDNSAAGGTSSGGIVLLMPTGSVASPVDSRPVDVDRTITWSSTRATSTPGTNPDRAADDLAVAMTLKNGSTYVSHKGPGANTEDTSSTTRFGITEFAPFTLTSPNGGESFFVGQNDTASKITWSAASSVGAHNWQLQYSTASSTLNIQSSTNATPIVITTTAVHGLSSGESVVISGHTVNTNANGTWTIISTGASTFSLIGSTGNGVGGATGTVTYRAWTNAGSWCGSAGTAVCTQATAALSVGEIQWRVPDQIGTQFRLRILDTTGSQTGPVENEGRRADSSNADFTIKRSLAATSPTTGENYIVGDTNRYIKWDYTGSTNWGNVRLEYSTNNGGAWNTIPDPDGGGSVPDPVSLAVNYVAAGCTPADNPPYAGHGCWNWNPLPDYLSALPSQTLVRVVAIDTTVDGTAPVSASPTFNIKRQLTLVSPTHGMGAGESYTSQTPWNIQWTYKGETSWGTVKLEYSTNGGIDWTGTIATGVSKGSGGTGSYSATNIPAGAIGTQTRVRVVSAEALVPTHVDAVIADAGDLFPPRAQRVGGTRGSS